MSQSLAILCQETHKRIIAEGRADIKDCGCGVESHSLLDSLQLVLFLFLPAPSVALACLGLVVILRSARHVPPCQGLQTLLSPLSLPVNGTRGPSLAAKEHLANGLWSTEI